MQQMNKTDRDQNRLTNGQPGLNLQKSKLGQTKCINPRKLQIQSTYINQEKCFGSTIDPKVAAKILKLPMRKLHGGIQLVGGRRPKKCFKM